MHSKLSALALVVLCSVVLSVSGNPAATYIAAKADQTLMKYMMQPKAATIDGNNALVCFNYYIPIINGITETYQKNYEACITTANSEIEQLDEEGAESRDNITSVSNDVCAQYSSCQAESDNLDFFDCYSNSGDQAVRSVYSASQDASEAAANYREQLRVIKTQSEKCTNETQRIYVTDTANAYDDLDDCLANGLQTTVAPSTAEPSTAEPSTAEPSTAEPSTAEPSTAEPSTAEPSTAEPSTAEPSTAEPSTAEPSTAEPSTAEPSTAEPSTAEPSTAEPSGTTTEEATTDADPVEELKLAEQTGRSRLEAFIKNWGKRLG